MDEHRAHRDDGHTNSRGCDVGGLACAGADYWFDESVPEFHGGLFGNEAADRAKHEIDSAPGKKTNSSGGVMGRADTDIARAGHGAECEGGGDDAGTHSTRRSGRNYNTHTPCHVRGKWKAT